MWQSNYMDEQVAMHSRGTSKAQRNRHKIAQLRVQKSKLGLHLILLALHFFSSLFSLFFIHFFLFFSNLIFFWWTQGMTWTWKGLVEVWWSQWPSFFYPKMGLHHNLSIGLPFLYVFMTSYSTTGNSCSNYRKSYRKHKIPWNLNFSIAGDEYGWKNMGIMEEMKWMKKNMGFFRVCFPIIFVSIIFLKTGKNHNCYEWEGLRSLALFLCIFFFFFFER